MVANSTSCGGAILIGSKEVRAEDSECFVGFWFGSPFTTSSVEEASAEDKIVASADIIRFANGDITSNCKFARGGELIKKSFNWSWRMPRLTHAGDVGIKIVGCDFAIGGPEVGKESKSGDIAKSDITVFKGTNEAMGTGIEELLAESAIDAVVGAESAEHCHVGAVCLGNLWSGSTGGVDRISTWVDWCNKGDVGGEGCIFGWLHHKD